MIEEPTQEKIQGVEASWVQRTQLGRGNPEPTEQGMAEL